jgi:hypothetical protein
MVCFSKLRRWQLWQLWLPLMQRG